MNDDQQQNPQLSSESTATTHFATATNAATTATTTTTTSLTSLFDPPVIADDEKDENNVTSPRMTTPQHESSTSSLTGLFAPPHLSSFTPSTTNNKQDAPVTHDATTTTTTTTTTASLSSLSSPPVSLPDTSKANGKIIDDAKPPLSVPKRYNDTQNTTNDKTGGGGLTDLFLPPSSATSTSTTTTTTTGETTALLQNNRHKDNSYYYHSGSHEVEAEDTREYMVATKDQPENPVSLQEKTVSYSNRCFLDCCQQEVLQPTTFAGSLMFLLYHVVFCLANASAIAAGNPAILGVMAKLSAVGILGCGPFYIWRLGNAIPALYPSIDLFLAPFLAQAAALVQESLNNNDEDPSPESFLASFCVLVGIGMLLSGILLQLAATFKLANLGTYLPYSVLCGFFSAVGVLLWALAFSVDTSGVSWKQVVMSRDPQLVWLSLLHHCPSLVVGILMNRLGPKNPFYVILLIVLTITLFYTVMFMTGTTLEQAQHDQWFWSAADLKVEPVQEGGWLPLPPLPLATLPCLFSKYTDWNAVSSGLGNMAALAFLYLLRSSIHASAMKKNIGNLVRRIPLPDNVATTTTNISLEGGQDPTMDVRDDHDDDHEDTTAATAAYNIASNIFESVSQSVRIVNLSMADKNKLGNGKLPESRAPLPVASFQAERQEPSFAEVRAKATRLSLEEIFQEYGYSLLLVSVFGGFGNCPTVATSNTMFAIGADRPAPQYGSVVLLILFYVTDFTIVQYIPKTAFSSLLVLGAVDTLMVWFFGAFQKTQDLTEWMVVPIIVFFSLFVGFLNAVFLGIGISMFVFVASFFRVGVVKFHATGLEIRSRIERSMAQSVFLDQYGDFVQLLVLQNYLFFGNASSIFNYIVTMFEDVPKQESCRLDFSLPPIPKVLVLDLSLISGMDTSTVDIFKDIKELCKNNDCKLYLCGLSRRIRKGFALGGIQQETGVFRSKRSVRIFPDLDTALGSAEDFLIHYETSTVGGDASSLSMDRPKNPGSSGFLHALKQIDELHGQEFANGLVDLEAFVEPVELEPGSCLFESDGGVVHDRGLFFIEYGLLKITTDATRSLTLTRTYSSQHLNKMSNSSTGANASSSNLLTLKNQHARMGTLARKAALAKTRQSPQSLRLARIGPGW